jgi:hypothetical protein
VTCPVIGLPVLLRVVWIRDFEVLVVPSHEVLEDSPALENTDHITVLIFVGKGWDSAVGVDLKEPGFLIFLREDINFDKLETRTLVETLHGSLVIEIPCNPSPVQIAG